MPQSNEHFCDFSEGKQTVWTGTIFSPAIFAKALMRTQTCTERFNYKWHRFKWNNCLFFYFSCTLYLHLVFHPFEDRLYFRKVSFSRGCLKPCHTSDCDLKVHCQRWSARAESGTSQFHCQNVVKRCSTFSQHYCLGSFYFKVYMYVMQLSIPICTPLIFGYTYPHLMCTVKEMLTTGPTFLHVR